MKITLGSKALLEKLQILGAVIPAKATLPIIENFHFSLSGQQLEITATDLETTISTGLEVEAIGKCDIAVPAKLLVEILKLFSDQSISLQQEDQLIIIKSATGEYSIPFTDGGEFPKASDLEEASQINVSSTVLTAAISMAMFAVGKDDLRPVMNGMFFQCSSAGFNLVATDSYKLFMYSRSEITSDQPFDFIVPRKPLAVLKTAIGTSDFDVVIDYNESNAKFMLEDYTISCRLIDGKYPNYAAIIPAENPNVLLIDRVSFLKAVRCVSVFSDRITHQVKLDIKKDLLVLSAEDIEYSNAAKERLLCDYSGEPMTIAFSSRFLTEMLANLNSENVNLKMSAPNRAGLISPVDGLEHGESILMLVMPVMLK